MLLKEKTEGHKREIVGLEVDWAEVEARYYKFGLTPAAPSQASRVAIVGVFVIVRLPWSGRPARFDLQSTRPAVVRGVDWPPGRERWE